MQRRSNWMASVANRSLFDLTIPGTHHSATGTIASARPSLAVCRRHAQCQFLSILQQLHAGVRCLDVRLRLGSDGIIRASHSNRLSARLKLEHLFASMEEVVQQLCEFVDSSRSEVVLLILDTDCDPPDWPAMPGDCWHRVHVMLQPLLHRLVPYDQRLKAIGQITAAGRNVCVVCQQLRDAHGETFWPNSVRCGSWGETDSSTWLELHARLQSWVTTHPAVTDGSSLRYVQGEITQRVSTVLMCRTIRDDATRANAVLLDLLHGSWVGVPLHIVTHDFCCDAVVGALVSRNVILHPPPSPPPPPPSLSSSAAAAASPSSSSRSCICSPDELTSSDTLTSSNGRYTLAFSPSPSADCCLLRIVTSDNVPCLSISIPVSPSLLPHLALRPDPATRSLVCVFREQVVWRSAPSGACNCNCRPRSILPHMLVITDYGELQVEQQRSDGSTAVVWGSRNRLVSRR
jgi:hypothetical protein